MIASKRRRAARRPARALAGARDPVARLGGAGAGAPRRRARGDARRSGARSFELRSALSLARLWQSQGKHDDGRALVERLFSTFTEGFETGDLREARELLAR